MSKEDALRRINQPSDGEPNGERGLFVLVKRPDRAGAGGRVKKPDLVRARVLRRKLPPVSSF